MWGVESWSRQHGTGGRTGAADSRTVEATVRGPTARLPEKFELSLAKIETPLKVKLS